MITAPVAVLLAALQAGGPQPAAAARPDSARPAPTTVAELRERIQEVLDSTHTPGVSLALVTRDSVIWAGGVGKADVASGRAATGQTLFRIGSTSKSVTALAVMMLQEEGKLRLDDPIRRHAPEIAYKNPWEATDTVRIAHVLEHSSGFDDWGFRDIANSNPSQIPLREALDFNPGTRVSRWRPGTRVSYSNSGPPIAAYIVEKIEGKPFEQVVDERVFGPIGMKTATFLFPDTSRVPVATLYHDDGTTPFPYWYVHQRPAGSINASAEDMAAYVRFLLNRGAVNGRQLVEPASIVRMERPQRSLEATAGLPVGYGLHLGTYVDSGRVWVGHDGGVMGGITNMAYMPDAGVGYSFSINAADGGAFARIQDLVRAFITRGVPRPVPPPRAPMPAAAGARYAGFYRPDNPRTQRFYWAERIAGITRVSVDDSALVLKPLFGEADRYVPVSATLFRGADEPVATLALVDDARDGRPAAIERMGYLLPTSLVRVPTPLALLELGLAAAWLVAALVTLVVALFYLGRAIVRKLRRRAAGTRPSPRFVRGPWGVPFFTTVVLFAGLALLAIPIIRGTIDALGRPSLFSVSGFVLLLLFAVLAVLGLVAALRRRGPAGRTTAATTRVVAGLHAVAGAYLLYWGMIGWRPWS